ncbi:BH3 interacting domain death agonist isoform X2 [Antennarius striatus]
MNLAGGQNSAMVMLAFLQADCRNPECRKELFSLSQEMNDISLVEDIEMDGFLSSSIADGIRDIQPSIGLHRPGDHVDAAAIHQVAEELRGIAAQIELNIVARATENLSRNIQTSPLNEWKNYISSEVDRVMRQGVYLNDLPQERVIMALTFTLVKGVCEQNPLHLRHLFNSALQYITQGRPR